MAATDKSRFPEFIRSRLLSRRKRGLSLEGYTPCAVLVPLFLKSGRYHLLFTERSRSVRDHKGQISFPGGCREKADADLVQTALRETEEEIGLKPAAVEVLGELGDLFTPTRYRITPFVGWIRDPMTLKLNRDEIERAFEIPLDHLANPRNFKSEASELYDRSFDYPFFRYRGHTIWGATGRITREFLSLLKKRY